MNTVMRQKCYLTLATGRVWLISYKLHLSDMCSHVGQIFQTASLHRDHLILYALVCVKELSHMGKTTEIMIWCARKRLVLHTVELKVKRKKRSEYSGIKL